MTNEQKHTPGPWHVGMKPGPIIYGPKGEQVTMLTTIMLSEDEAIGNMKLIARAPELLAENEQLRTHNAELVRALRKIAEKSIDTDARNSARAILAKVQA